MACFKLFFIEINLYAKAEHYNQSYFSIILFCSYLLLDVTPSLLHYVAQYFCQQTFLRIVDAT